MVNTSTLKLGLKTLNAGLNPNDQQGESLRSAALKINENFTILSEAVPQKLEGTTQFYVSESGVDTNNGLSVQAAVRTITKALVLAYESNLAGHQIFINLLPGTYTESVSISGTPVGGNLQNTSSPAAIVIKKEPTSVGIINWKLNATTYTQCLAVKEGARVEVRDIIFSQSTITTIDQRRFIYVKDSFLQFGGCEFQEIGNPSEDALTAHVWAENSHVDIISDYTISGRAHRHLLAKNSSSIEAPAQTGDPKTCTLSNSPEFEYFVEAYKRSDVILPDETIVFTGTGSGPLYTTDFDSNVILEQSSGFSVGEHRAKTFPNPVTFTSQVDVNGGLISVGAFEASSTAEFNGPVTVTSTSTFSGNATFNADVHVPTQSIEDNTTKAASTAFVQSTVESKLVQTLPISTDELFGIVKTDILESDPVVYTVTTADSLLAQKANINSPTLTGTPQAPTRTLGDNSSAIATTAYVDASLENQVHPPIGSIIMWPSNVPPDRYLFCEGQYISRVTYAELFAIIGTTWGSTDVNNFRLPLFTDRFPIGAGYSYGLAAYGGSATVTLNSTNMPAHNHQVYDPGHIHNLRDRGHSHDIRDPGHNHSYRTGARSTVDDDPETRAVTNWDFSNYRTSEKSQTGISVKGSKADIEVKLSGTGITLGNSGSNAPFNIIPPYTAIRFCIKFS
jgi:hypothetical protein